MKSVLINLLVMVVSRLIGSIEWDKVLSVVKTMSFSGLSGEQKRQEALAVLRDSLNEVKSSLLNLALEIAVAKLKSMNS